MPKRRYERQEPTHEWSQIRPLLKDSAQIKYELIRPVILWGVNTKERAAETGEPRSTLYYQASLFDQMGMASLLPQASDRGLWLQTRDSQLKMLQEIPLTDEERAAVDGDVHALDHLLEQLKDVPTPSACDAKQRTQTVIPVSAVLVTRQHASPLGDREA